MGKIAKGRLKREFLETLTSKERYRWFKEIQKLICNNKSAKEACKIVDIKRSTYNYWNRRINKLLECKKHGSTLRVDMFRSLSRAPHYSPRQIPENDL